MHAPLPWVAALCGSALSMAACATTHEQQTVAAFERVDATLLEAPSQTALKKADFTGVAALERFALDRNPAVRAAYLDWKAAVVAIPGVRAWPAPLLTYAGLPSPIETRVGPQEHRVGVSQAIPWPGKFEARADVMASRAMVAAQRFEAARVAVLERVRTPYVRLASLKARTTVLSEQIILLRQLSTAVQARMAVGKASLAQAARISLLIAYLEDRIARIAAMQAPLEAQVRSAAGLTHDSTLPAVGALPAITTVGTPVTELRKRLAAHPKARIHVAVAAVQRATVAQEESLRYPDFMLGVDWMVIGSPSSTAMAGSDAGRDAVMGMVGVKIPLSLGAYDARERAAEARAAAAEARRDAVIADAHATMTSLLTRMKEAARRQALYEKTLAPQAKVAFDSALANYSAARGDFKDLMELAKRLLEYRFEVVVARTEHALARVALDYLVGFESPAVPQGKTKVKP